MIILELTSFELILKSQDTFLFYYTYLLIYLYCAYTCCGTWMEMREQFVKVIVLQHGVLGSNSTLRFFPILDNFTHQNV